jgi:hypothetical protein
MKKEWIRNLVALAILAGMVLFVSWNRKSKFEKGEKEEKAKNLVTFDLKDAQKLEVETSQGLVTFERRPTDAKGKYTDAWSPLSEEFDTVSGWAMVSPISALPDQYSVNAILDNLKELAATKIIDEKGANPKEYNLEKPPVTIRIFEKGKAEPKLAVRVGDANSATSGLYMQTSDKPQIVLGSMSLDYLKTRKISDWRNKEIVGYKDVKKMKSLEAQYPQAKTVLKMTKDNGNWFSTAPKLPVDERSVETLLADIKGMRATDIVSDNADIDAAKYGFDRPYAKFTFQFDGDNGVQTRSVVIGGKIEKDKPIFVRRTDFPQVYSVPGTMKDTLTKKLSDMVDKKPLAVAEGEVKRVMVVHSGVTTELEKVESRWNLLQPVKDVADSSEVSALLAKLIDWKAEEFLPTSKDRPKSKPSTTLLLDLGDKKRQLDVYEIKDKKKVYGVRRDLNLDYRFNRIDFEQVLVKLEGVREKGLSPVETELLSSIKIQRGDQTVEMIRNAKGEWSPATHSDLARNIGNLRITQFLVKAPETNSKSIPLRVEFRPKSANAQSWEIAETIDGNWVGFSKERNARGEVKREDIEAIQKLLTGEKPKEKG